jgi:hypothetical protein
LFSTRLLAGDPLDERAGGTTLAAVGGLDDLCFEGRAAAVDRENQRGSRLCYSGEQQLWRS